MSNADFNTRQLLLDLGIGDFNATMILPYLFMGPAQTDPAMAQVQLLTKAIQRQLIVMGATWIKPSGTIDDPTAHCFHALMGPHWNQTTWGELAKAILVAKGNGKKFRRPVGPSQPVQLAGLGSFPEAPSVPGGIITYAVVGVLLFRHFWKGR